MGLKSNQQFFINKTQGYVLCKIAGEGEVGMAAGGKKLN